MSYSIKVQRTIHAPIEQVWAGLTQPELVKQYFFGTDLVTTWEPNTPIEFIGQWEGQAYRDKGTVLHYESCKMLRYNYFSSWSDLEDLPENYQVITYRVKSKGTSTILTIEQAGIDTLEKKQHSAQNWSALMIELKKLMEQ
jgi:uncharacterized protein YndB with AHSA1/START domain